MTHGENHRKKDRFTADKPTDGKRERFTVGPPDHEKRERFAVGPPDKRSNAENALKQQLFLIPLSVSSVVGFGPGLASFGAHLHGGTRLGLQEGSQDALKSAPRGLQEGS